MTLNYNFTIIFAISTGKMEKMSAVFEGGKIREINLTASIFSINYKGH